MLSESGDCRSCGRSRQKLLRLERQAGHRGRCLLGMAAPLPVGLIAHLKREIPSTYQIRMAEPGLEPRFSIESCRLYVFVLCRNVVSDDCESFCGPRRITLSEKIGLPISYTELPGQTGKNLKH